MTEKKRNTEDLLRFWLFLFFWKWHFKILLSKYLLICFNITVKWYLFTRTYSWQIDKISTITII